MDNRLHHICLGTAATLVQSEAVAKQTKLLKQKYLNKSDPLSLSKIDSERAKHHHMTRQFSYPCAKNHRGLQISYRPCVSNGPALSSEPLIFVLLPQRSFCSQGCPAPRGPGCVGGCVLLANASLSSHLEIIERSQSSDHSARINQ